MERQEVVKQKCESSCLLWEQKNNDEELLCSHLHNSGLALVTWIAKPDTDRYHDELIVSYPPSFLWQYNRLDRGSLSLYIRTLKIVVRTVVIAFFPGPCTLLRPTVDKGG